MFEAQERERAAGERLKEEMEQMQEQLDNERS